MGVMESKRKSEERREEGMDTSAYYLSFPKPQDWR